MSARVNPDGWSPVLFVRSARLAVGSDSMTRIEHRRLRWVARPKEGLGGWAACSAGAAATQQAGLKNRAAKLPIFCVLKVFVHIFGRFKIVSENRKGNFFQRNFLFRK